jgi:hypothetical protein
MGEGVWGRLEGEGKERVLGEDIKICTPASRPSKAKARGSAKNLAPMIGFWSVGVRNVWDTAFASVPLEYMRGRLCLH